MSDESRKFLEERRAKVEFTPIVGEQEQQIDRGVLDVLAKFRPQDNRTLQIERLDDDEYVIYDFPEQYTFDNWDEDRNGAKHYVVRKLRLLKLEGGETSVQEVFHVVEALLHNYNIVNVDLLAEHAGVRRPQAHVPLGINRAIRETLGEM